MTFSIKPQKELVVNNSFVRKNIVNPEVVILDVRNLQQSTGLLKHGLAESPGRIPGTVLLPVAAFYEDHLGIKEPEELLWVLKEGNIHPNRAIIVFCKTGWCAGAAGLSVAIQAMRSQTA